MKAVLQRRYGPPSKVLLVGEVQDPEPGPQEVLVRVEAASLHPDVWHAVTGRPYVLRLMGSGFRRPKVPIPGTDMAGRVVGLGPGATRFRMGDRVFGETTGEHQWRNGAAFAERVRVAESALEAIPPGVSSEAASTVATSGMIAWQNLHGGDLIAPGARVLVNGAAGGVGLFAVQIAKARGAHVTGVDAGPKLDLVRAAGADDVIDYERDRVGAADRTFDVIVDVASTLTVADVKRLLPPGGHYILIGHDHYGRGAGRWVGSIGRFLRLTLLSFFVPQLRSVRTFDQRSGALAALGELLANGTLKPAVHRTYPLERAHEALQDLAAGRNIGRLVLVP